MAFSLVANGSAQELRFLDISSIDRTTVPTRVEPRITSIFSTPADGTVDPADDVDSTTNGGTGSLLAIDSEKVLAIGDLRDEVVTLGSPVVPLEFMGATHHMALIERVRDFRFDAYHLTFVSTATQDYVRLSVAGSYVAGTLYIGGRYYALSPVGPGRQLLSQVDSSPATCVSRSFDAGTDLGRSIARHAQLACVADVQPAEFETDSDGHLVGVAGGNLGLIAGIRQLFPATDHAIPADRSVELLTLVSDYLQGMSALLFIQDEALLEGGELEFFGTVGPKPSETVSVGIRYLNREVGNESIVVVVIASSGKVLRITTIGKR